MRSHDEGAHEDMRATRDRTTSTSTTLPVGLLVALLLLVTALASAPAGAEEPPAPAAPPAPPAVSLPEQASPQAVLATAERVLDGDAVGAEPDPSMALLELRHVLDELPPEGRQRARALLARPSEAAGTSTSAGTASPAGAARICDEDLCVRYVTDPTSRHFATEPWARHTFEVLQDVWRTEVDQMGYRAPLPDGRPAGDDRLDIELRDIGDRYYGYCTPDRSTKRTSGFCVLDNDYAEFDDPDASLRATAAHEFFHVVQYAYDSYEDPWFMESSATWIEEQVFDDVDDNRQYLRGSQLRRPHLPLDTYGRGAHYGNWIYLEHLAGRFGDPLVRRAWQLAAGRKYSLTALRTALAEQGSGFARDYARFAGGNTHPATAYPEGGAYGRPRPAETVRLSAGSRRAGGAEVVDHLASATWRVVPDPGMTRRTWRLRVTVDGPGRRAAPQLAVTVLRTDGSTGTRVVRLDRRGRGGTVVPFSAARVRDVSVTAVNASTRYRCWRGTSHACQGVARDDDRRLELRLRAVRR